MSKYTSTTRDKLLDGGAVLFADKMSRRGAHGANIVGRQHLDDAERGAVRLSFVYDFVHVTTPFSQLEFLFDANRAPLVRLGEIFHEKYTFPQKLEVTDAKMRAQTYKIDWFTDIYT